MDPKSRDIFAFKWKDPEMEQEQQYRWAVILQGFTESPNLFGKVLEQTLEKFQPPEGMLMLQYVDDLLLSGQEKY